MELEARIRERIAEIERARDEFTRQANIQIAVDNAAIAELRRLLEPPDMGDAPAEPDRAAPGGADNKPGGVRPWTR